MLQKNILLDYKFKVNKTKNFTIQMNYNFIKGIWELKEGFPLVSAMINNHSLEYGATLVTETREGIDRSERS